MDSLFLLQFACFIFMLVNAFFLALSHLHVRWESKRYERSRWMIVVALIGLAIQYAVQMLFGFRAMHDNLGAVINIVTRTSRENDKGLYATMNGWHIDPFCCIGDAEG